MTQQFLYNTQIGTSVQKMSGKGMTKRVRVCRVDRSAVEQPPHIAWCDLVTASVEEYGLVGRVGGDELWATLADPLGNSSLGRFRYRHAPLFVALAPHRDRAGRSGEVASLQAAELGDTQATAVEKLHNGPVA